MTRIRRTTVHGLALATALLVSACTGEIVTPGEPDPTDPGYPEGTGEGAAGGEDNTYDHPDALPDIWELLDRLKDEGPATFSSRVHACKKMRYETIGGVLTRRGVNVGNNTALTAGRLYRDGRAALGAPNYGARISEATDLTTAGASKLYDVFAQAAPEIIAQMPSRTECAVGGVPTEFFDATNKCTARGIACLTGMPAVPAQIELCNHIVTSASTPEKGRIMAVAIVAAAAHTCE